MSRGVSIQTAEDFHVDGDCHTTTMDLKCFHHLKDSQCWNLELSLFLFPAEVWHMQLGKLMFYFWILRMWLHCVGDSYYFGALKLHHLGVLLLFNIFCDHP